MAHGGLEDRGGVLWLHIYKDPECWGNADSRVEEDWPGGTLVERSKQSCGPF